MTELRLNGKTPDGANLSLIDHEGQEYLLRISDTLRATVNQPRLVQVSNEEPATVTVKEVQELADVLKADYGLEPAAALREVLS